MFYEIFVHNPQLIYEIQFSAMKISRPALAASVVRQMLTWWRHIDKCIAIKYFSITCRGVFIQRLQCMPLKEIDISNEVLHSYTTESCLLNHFYNFYNYCFHVTSHIQFPVKIGPASLLHALTVLCNWYICYIILYILSQYYFTFMTSCDKCWFPVSWFYLGDSSIKKTGLYKSLIHVACQYIVIHSTNVTGKMFVKFYAEPLSVTPTPFHYQNYLSTYSILKWWVILQQINEGSMI